MEQSRLGSLIESLFNLSIGYCVGLFSQILIFPLFGVHVSLSTNIWLTTWFTVISLIRSYIIRRWFNSRLHRAAEAVALKVS